MRHTSAIPLIERMRNEHSQRREMSNNTSNSVECVLLHIRPRPLKGESMYSWLHRLATDNGFITVHQLFIDISLTAFRTHDFDLIGDDTFFATLSRACLIDEASVRALSLRSLEGTLARNFPRSAYHQWLIRPAARKAGGAARASYMFCPHCMEGPGPHYWRLNWRLSGQSICIEHRCLLMEDCLGCGQPFALDHCTTKSLGACPNCGELQFASERTKVPLPVLRFGQLIANSGRNTSECFPIPLAYEFQFWDGVWSMLVVLRAKHTSLPSLKKHFPPFVIDTLEIFGQLHEDSFECWDVESRMRGMHLIAWLLGEWPTRFVSLFSAVNLLGSRLFQLNGDAPFWIQVVFDQYLSRPKPTVSVEEVIAVANHLVRTRTRVSRIAIKRQLGITESKALDTLFAAPVTRLNLGFLKLIIENLQLRLDSARPGRAARAAMVRDFVGISLAMLANRTFQQLVGLTQHQAAKIWNFPAATFPKSALTQLLQVSKAWRQEYETIVRPEFADHRPHQNSYLLNRFGKPYGCNGMVGIFANVLRDVEYPHPERGCKVIADLHG